LEEAKVVNILLSKIFELLFDKKRSLERLLLIGESNNDN